MALSGIHIEVSKAGVGGNAGSLPVVVRNAVWSENVTAANTASTNAVGAGDGWIATVTAAADSYLGIGSTPVSNANPRRYLPAGIPRDFAVNEGDKFSFTLA